CLTLSRIQGPMILRYWVEMNKEMLSCLQRVIKSLKNLLVVRFVPAISSRITSVRVSGLCFWYSQSSLITLKSSLFILHCSGNQVSSRAFGENKNIKSNSSWYLLHRTRIEFVFPDSEGPRKQILAGNSSSHSEMLMIEEFVLLVEKD